MAMMWPLLQQPQLLHLVVAGLHNLTFRAIATASTTQALLAAQTGAMTSAMAATLEAITVSASKHADLNAIFLCNPCF